MTPNLHIRSFSNDQYVLDKVFYANFYRLKAFSSTEKKPVVMDVGAHCGYFSFAAQSMGAKKIYAFEPFFENYKMLIKNIGDERLGPVSLYQMGIYVSDLVYPFCYPELSNGAYFDFANIGIERNLDNPRFSISPCISLDNALEFYAREAIDLLKLSIGYAEMSILLQSKKIETMVSNICGETILDATDQIKFKSLMASKGFIDSNFQSVHGEEENKIMFQFSRNKLSDIFDTSPIPNIR